MTGRMLKPEFSTPAVLSHVFNDEDSKVEINDILQLLFVCNNNNQCCCRLVGLLFLHGLTVGRMTCVGLLFYS